MSKKTGHLNPEEIFTPAALKSLSSQREEVDPVEMLRDFNFGLKRTMKAPSEPICLEPWIELECFSKVAGFVQMSQ